MSNNIHDKAHEMSKIIRESEEFNNIKEAYNNVNADPETKKTFDDFRNIQMTLQQKQMQGEEITEEEVQQAQASAEQIEQNETIKGLMEAEQSMSVLIQDVNKIIMEPIEELYGLQQDEE